MFGLFKKKPKQPTYAGPLNIDLICLMLEAGTLQNKLIHAGDLISIDNENFSLRILTKGWQFNEKSEAGQYSPESGKCAARYKVEGKSTNFSIDVHHVNMLLDAASRQEKIKLNKALECIQAKHDRKLIEQL